MWTQCGSSADIRWQQRFVNYKKALAQLETFLLPPALNEREQQGLIKAFEYTFELAWNTLRDLLRSQGDATLLGSRDTLRETFRLGLIENGGPAIAEQIIHNHLPCFRQLLSRLEQRLAEELAQDRG